MCRRRGRSHDAPQTPHSSWTDQEATLLQTASFCSVQKSEKNKHNTKSKRRLVGMSFDDDPMKRSLRTCRALPPSPHVNTNRLSQGRRPLSHFTFSRKRKKKGHSGCRGKVEERHDTRSIPSILLFLLPASRPRRSHFFQHPVLGIICCCRFVLLYHCTAPPLLFRRDIVS